MNIPQIIQNYISLLPRFSYVYVVEILIIFILIYEVLLWLKNTRAMILFKGIVVILLFLLVAWITHLDTILFIFEKISAVAVLSLVVIFQPELRKALEQLGSSGIMKKLHGIGKPENDLMSKETAEAIADAVFSMASKKTGALIVVEQNEKLDEYVKTGILIKGIVSSGLLINIFEKNTPLHDGAVIIKGNEVVSATSYLPLSQNLNINKSFGTRHRAGLGISEVTDSITVIVSEETGGVSIAYKSNLMRIMDKNSLVMNLLSQDRENDNERRKN